jgi:hypothetical protein
MGVKVGERKDKPGWWVFINHQGRRTKKYFGRDKKGATAFADKLSARLKWAEASGENLSHCHNPINRCRRLRPFYKSG